MRRREFIAALSCAAAAWPLTAGAQPTGRVQRVGLIAHTAPIADMVGADPINPNVRAFVHGLRDLGRIEGKNLALEFRSGEGNEERFGGLVAELLRREVDVIVTVGDVMTRAAMRVTNTVPIVMAGSYDPVEAGIVTSLSRPGGNVTGFSNSAGPEIESKRLHLLKHAFPDATRVAFLGKQRAWEDLRGTAIRAAARPLGVTLIHAEHNSAQYADAFAFIDRERPNALFIASDPQAWNARRLIADFVTRRRIRDISFAREFVEAGGLMSYGHNLPDQFRRAAGHVARILRGAKPADIPVEQPVKFEFVVNLRAAKAMNLDLPATVLALADEVIE